MANCRAHRREVGGRYGNQANPIEGFYVNVNGAELFVDYGTEFNTDGIKKKFTECLMADEYIRSIYGSTAASSSSGGVWSKDYDDDGNVKWVKSGNGGSSRKRRKNRRKRKTQRKRK